MYDVEIVMPVYNESECIDEVVRDWTKELDSLGMTYRIVVLNDGSSDGTAEVLAKHENNPKVKVINKQNSGHGPTILHGYHSAVQEAQWVFQVDSDNEIKAEHFKGMWSEREGCDALIGMRDGRLQPLPRKIISFVSRLVVSIFWGWGVQDANCPFRLMKSEVLRPMLEQIPINTFAPNVAISGLFACRKEKVRNIPIPHNNRRTGKVSIKKWNLLNAATKSFIQTVSIRLRSKAKK